MGERWAGAADPLTIPRMGEFQTVISERCTIPTTTGVAGGKLNDQFGRQSSRAVKGVHHLEKARDPRFRREPYDSTSPGCDR
jgi:hypothetical protein